MTELQHCTSVVLYLVYKAKHTYKPSKRALFIPNTNAKEEKSHLKGAITVLDDTILNHNKLVSIPQNLYYKKKIVAKNSQEGGEDFES